MYTITLFNVEFFADLALDHSFSWENIFLVLFVYVITGALSISVLYTPAHKMCKQAKRYRTTVFEYPCKIGFFRRILAAFCLKK